MNIQADLSENISHIWTMVCVGSSIDRDSGNVSLFNVMEQLSLDENQVKNAKVKQKRSDITVPTRFELVTLWRRRYSSEREERLVRLEFMSPEETVLMSHDLPLKFEVGKQRFRFRAKFDGLKITTAGSYYFRASLLNSEGLEPVEMVRLPLEINIVKRNK